MIFFKEGSNTEKSARSRGVFHLKEKAALVSLLGLLAFGTDQATSQTKSSAESGKQTLMQRLEAEYPNFDFDNELRLIRAEFDKRKSLLGGPQGKVLQWTSQSAEDRKIAVDVLLEQINIFLAENTIQKKDSNKDPRVRFRKALIQAMGGTIQKSVKEKKETPASGVPPREKEGGKNKKSSVSFDQVREMVYNFSLDDWIRFFSPGNDRVLKNISLEVWRTLRPQTFPGTSASAPAGIGDWDMFSNNYDVITEEQRGSLFIMYTLAQVRNFPGVEVGLEIEDMDLDRLSAIYFSRGFAEGSILRSLPGLPESDRIMLDEKMSRTEWTPHFNEATASSILKGMQDKGFPIGNVNVRDLKIAHFLERINLYGVTEKEKSFLNDKLNELLQGQDALQRREDLVRSLRRLWKYFVFQQEIEDAMREKGVEKFGGDLYLLETRRLGVPQLQALQLKLKTEDMLRLIEEEIGPQLGKEKKKEKSEK